MKLNIQDVALEERHPDNIMALPNVDQFPDFQTITYWLGQNANYCVWFLPDKGRYCKIGITADESTKAFKLAQIVCSSNLSTASSIKYLNKIAEGCCCARHHRNKIYGSGLSHDLAIRWHKELRPHDVVTAKAEPQTQVSFAKHVLHESQSLLSTLLSNLDSRARKVGSLYIYTHAKSEFSGMIKIGYTGGTVASRLNEWDTCGHGYPQLLHSISNVRHPERVEQLVHLELEKCWHEMRWCTVHRKAHIEWFEVSIEEATKIAIRWCWWMEHAEPYDRRGCLKTVWKNNIDFLLSHHTSITSEDLTLVQRIEEGSKEVYDFIDDDKLRQAGEDVVKKEEMDEAIALRVPVRR